MTTPITSIHHNLTYHSLTVPASHLHVGDVVPLNKQSELITGVSNMRVAAATNDEENNQTTVTFVYHREATHGPITPGHDHKMGTLITAYLQWTPINVLRLG